MAIATQFENLEHLRIPEVRDRQRNIPCRTNLKPYLQVFYDPSSATQWTSFLKDGPTVITKGLVNAFLEAQYILETRATEKVTNDCSYNVQFHVLASEIPNIFNLGGDLVYLSELVRGKKRELLQEHAHACVELIYRNAVSFDLPITTISLVQGSALGGGFEAALSSNILVAEKGSKMSLPEVMFNMFPGMGAYPLLCRRIAPTLAEKIILSGKTYTAEELFEIGVVDILAEKGQGENAVWSYIKRHKNQTHGEWGFRKMVNATHPALRLEDLMKSADVWVDTALSLSTTDLKHMDFVIRAQKRAFS